MDTAAWKEGHNAYQFGIGANDCPYDQHHLEQRVAWLQGWLDGQAEHQFQERLKAAEQAAGSDQPL